MKIHETREGAEPGAEPWHPQDIIAAVRKKGTSLQRLALEHGFSRVTFNMAATKKFPNAHNIIAAVIGVPRQEIWPQFYGPSGKSLGLTRRRPSRAA